MLFHLCTQYARQVHVSFTSGVSCCIPGSPLHLPSLSSLGSSIHHLHSQASASRGRNLWHCLLQCYAMLSRYYPPVVDSSIWNPARITRKSDAHTLTLDVHPHTHPQQYAKPMRWHTGCTATVTVQTETETRVSRFAIAYSGSTATFFPWRSLVAAGGRTVEGRSFPLQSSVRPQRTVKVIGFGPLSYGNQVSLLVRYVVSLVVYISPRDEWT